MYSKYTQHICSQLNWPLCLFLRLLIRLKIGHTCHILQNYLEISLHSSVVFLYLFISMLYVCYICVIFVLYLCHICVIFVYIYVVFVSPPSHLSQDWSYLQHSPKLFPNISSQMRSTYFPFDTVQVVKRPIYWIYWIYPNTYNIQYICQGQQNVNLQPHLRDPPPKMYFALNFMLWVGMGSFCSERPNISAPKNCVMSSSKYFGSL